MLARSVLEEEVIMVLSILSFNGAAFMLAKIEVLDLGVTVKDAIIDPNIV